MIVAAFKIIGPTTLTLNQNKMSLIIDWMIWPNCFFTLGLIKFNYRSSQTQGEDAVAQCVLKASQDDSTEESRVGVVECMPTIYN